jgi:hypothetical protein
MRHLQTLIPRDFHSCHQAAKIFPGACAIVDLPKSNVVIKSSLEPLRASLSPLQSFRAIVSDHGQVLLHIAIFLDPSW